MSLHSCVRSSSFVDPGNIREVHEKLMRQLRTEAIHISNK